jgi:4-amino-4-deoxy-L-arabinose transferase-like glycosyltransferase
MVEQAQERRAFILLSLFLFTLYLLLASLHVDSGDGATIYKVTRSVAQGDGFAIPVPRPGAVVVDAWGEPIPPQELRGGGPYGAWGPDGRYYAQYGIGQSLLALPLYLLGQGVYALTGWGTADFAARVGVMLLNPIVLALLGGTLYALARSLGYRRGIAGTVALLVGLASPLWVYSKTFFSEPLLALGFALALLLARRCAQEEGRLHWLLCGAALGGAILVKAVAIVVVPAYLLFAAWRLQGRWRRLLLMGFPLALGALGVAGYNLVRFGSPLDTGYRTAAWDVPPWVGGWGLLFSSGKGLLWYCPLIVAGIAGLIPLGKREPRMASLMAGVTGLYLSAHVSYNHWHGSGSWGPRLIMPIVPLLLLPLAEWLQHPPRQKVLQFALVLLITVSFVVQVPAILVHPARALQALYARSASPRAYTLNLLYRPVSSPLLLQWRSFLEVAAITRTPDARRAVREMAWAAGATEPGDRLNNVVGYLTFNTFDLWPVYAAMLGVPWGWILFAEGGLALGVIAFAWRVRRLLL